MLFQEGPDIINVIVNHLKKNSFKRYKSLIRKISVPRLDANSVIFLKKEIFGKVVNDDRLR